MENNEAGFSESDDKVWQEERGKPETEISSIITPRDSAVGVAVHAPLHGSFGMNLYSAVSEECHGAWPYLYY